MKSEYYELKWKSGKKTLDKIKGDWDDIVDNMNRKIYGGKKKK